MDNYQTIISFLALAMGIALVVSQINKSLKKEEISEFQLSLGLFLIMLQFLRVLYAILEVKK